MKKLSLRMSAMIFVICMLCFCLGSCGADITPDDVTGNGSTEGDNTPIAEDNTPVTGDNVFVASYKDNGDGTVTVMFSVEGTVCVAGFSGAIVYDPSALTLKGDCQAAPSVVCNTNNSGEIGFSYGSVSDLTAPTVLFTAVFEYEGSVNTKVAVNVNEASNAALDTVSFSTKDANVVIG